MEFPYPRRELMVMDTASAEWQQPWTRLLSFRQHLPNDYEIHERLVGEYHALLKIFESLTGAELQPFSIPDAEIKPKVVSLSLGTRRSAGSANYSKDKYCKRTTFLMKLDALIPFLETTVQRGPLKAGEYALHPEIERVSGALYRDGHYKQAALEAFIRVIDEVKARSGLALDGDPLVNQAFGCDNRQPVLQFNDLRTDAQRDEQKGFLFLFKGIVGLRNMKAHTNQLFDSPERGFEYLSLASLLMRLLEIARRNEPPPSAQ
jgi:uncharacterized protein (TIGR02391 family)